VAEERLGHLAEAKRLYEKARLDARVAQLKDDEEAASQALRQIAARVPGVALRLPPDIRGVSVTVDGKRVDMQGGEVDLDPGERALVISAPGRADFRTTVTAAEGKRTELEVSLPLASGGSGDQAPPGGEGDTSGGGGGGGGGGGSLPPVGVMVLGGAGIVAGVVGLAMWGVGTGAEGDIRETCGGVTNCPVNLKEAADAAATKIIVGDVLVGVGAAAIIGGGVWWYMSKSGSSSSKAAPPAQARFFIAPSRGGAFATVAGHF
jgi:hypothetical protein